ncbi:MAG: PH domain-containing protein [Verrucomicrobiales bacterium]|nr:PH domain-containing protein [Verrucomicrobiales bacterium]
MYDQFSGALLRALRVPPRPEPPLGAPGSERVFRSGRNAFRLSLARWGIRQGFALIGLLFGLAFLGHLKSLRHEPVPAPTPPPASEPSLPAPEEPRPRSKKKRPPPSPREFLLTWSRRAPDVAVTLFTVLEGISVFTFLVQIPITYSLRRLEFEQRWYLVTDRSLRLRDGVWKLREVTMSFANLQQITVSQGPLQRLLGLSDVRVQSAGGGAPAPGTPEGAGANPSHLAVFREVDNAEEIRDLIAERLRQFRESGLGDPDEHRRTHPGGGHEPATGNTLESAREVLSEAKALRRALSGGRAAS